MKICLAMVCKNESQYIRAALQSAKPFVTNWSVFDTGSTDGTQDIVREEMVGIPGVLTEGVWEGWDKSRTKSIELARQSGCEWVLILDADETITGQIPQIQAHQVGRATVKFGSTAYTRPNLLNVKHNWHYVGVTHEYLTAPECPEMVMLPLTITTNPERATKTPEKCAEDARLLEQGLIAEPNNTRYRFYLANSYKDCGEKEKAIENYKKRVTMGGWVEEVYISLLRIAQLSEGLKTFPEVCDAYKVANEFRPQRAGETLRNLARYCLWWANGTAYPEGEHLFIDESCYLPRKKETARLKTLVIIPTQGKRADMLKEAYDSVQNQTRIPDKIVIAPGDAPLADRLNNIIEASDCDAYVMLGDDDLLEPTFIEKTAARMEETGVDIIHTKYLHFGIESCVAGSSNHISVTSLCRRSSWVNAGGYKNVGCFDYDFWLSCLETGAKTSFIDEPLWKYRIHAEQEGKQHNIKALTKAVQDRHPLVMGVDI